MRKAGGDTTKLEEDLKPVEIEPGSEALLATFSKMARTRGQGINGPLPITYSEIKAYCDLTQTALNQWELETIVALDAAVLDEAANATRSDK